MTAFTQEPPSRVIHARGKKLVLNSTRVKSWCLPGPLILSEGKWGLGGVFPVYCGGQTIPESDSRWRSTQRIRKKGTVENYLTHFQ